VKRAAAPDLRDIVRSLARQAGKFRPAPPAAHVYNPLDYARAPVEEYVRRFGGKRGRVLLVGMNPGPWGMAQTGIPFGDVAAVRDWMGISATVSRPEGEHPRVPVMGFDCHRREGSGKRLWGWAQERGSADDFFADHFVWNYCPLCFLDDGGANLVPEKLRPADREALTAICDPALAKVIDALAPRAAVGIGAFAEARLRAVAPADLPIFRLLHPSPANPLANKNWSGEADKLFASLPR
jgi:single-strand selective monofunctional uracil DNA glycosylase